MHQEIENMEEKEVKAGFHDSALESAEGKKEDALAQEQARQNSDLIDDLDKVNEIPKGELREPLEKLNQARILREKLKQELSDLKQKFETDNFELIANFEDAKGSVSSIETQTKELILKIYKETGIKTMELGVRVKEETLYMYDSDAALDWAKENMKVFILPETLDEKAFLKALSTMKNTPEFVTVKSEPKATLPTDIQKQFQESEK